MSERSADSVLVEVEGAVGRVTLSAPDRLNAVDVPMLEATADAVRRLDADPNVRVIVLSGQGRAFCAGADLSVHLDEGDLDGTLHGVGAVTRAVVEAGTPVIALVPGVAAGAGLAMALAADYVLVAEEATLVLAFGALGLMPDGGATALVVASIGRARALRLALTGERLTGTVAAEWGLVAESVPADDFAARADDLVAHLAALSPTGTARTTAAVTAAALDLDAALAREDEGQHALLRTPDFVEGLTAFREKRRPTFGP